MTYEDAENFFSELYYGKHHLPGKIKPWGEGWCINHLGELSTFDFDALTRLVFLAHDHCIRVSLMQGGIHSIKIAIWQRDGRTGSMYERHPTIEGALDIW